MDETCIKQLIDKNKNLNSYESYPKNPHLAKFFVQIGRAEELGMGIKKIFKFCNL